MAESLARTFMAIVGGENVSTDPRDLKEYSGAKTLSETRIPTCVVWPRTVDQVKRVVELANAKSVPIVPVSSGGPRLRGDTIPQSGNSVIVNLSKMNRILRVDRANKVAMVEAGVTYAEFVKELSKHGLRPLLPLLPRRSKSVVAGCLDREPITAPRYHWDSSDPLLCTEVVFGSGDLFRTGSAAGPGSLEEQWASGQAQKNPLGPSQFDPFRLIQGSQGSIGIVTWASVKCEIAPSVQKILFVQSRQIEDLTGLVYALLRRKLSDDLFILNSMSLSCALRKTHREIDALRKTLLPWNLIITLSGHGDMAKEELDYRIADTGDIAASSGIKLQERISKITKKDVSGLVGVTSENPYWKLRFSGGCQEVFALTTLDATPALWADFRSVSTKKGYPAEHIGAYIQPTSQGANAHFECDIFYDPASQADVQRAKTLYLEGSQALLKSGAYFSRPYGQFSGSVFQRCSRETISAMRRVKEIFDPKGIMNPGRLCFKEVQR
ncbi:MAG: FAD-binding oxidoreductase [Promethearchaeati archaeon SRVP18_Atabeyarchaeia-1]